MQEYSKMTNFEIARTGIVWDYGVAWAKLGRQMKGNTIVIHFVRGFGLD